jgi:hypothetical protein
MTEAKYRCLFHNKIVEAIKIRENKILKANNKAHIESCRLATTDKAISINILE